MSFRFAHKLVEKFAKATGEFPRLAQTDLLVMALTYDLQKEIGGLKDINVVPLLDVGLYFRNHV